MPQDGAAFAEAVHREVDLVDVMARLANCGDPKIEERAATLLLGLKYEKAGRGTESAASLAAVTWDLPRPVRD